MSDNPVFLELARAIYWFGTLLSFEIVFSILYQVDDGRISSRRSGRFSNTTKFLIVFILLGLGLYLLDRYLSEFTISFLSDFENTLIPILFAVVSFDVFYACFFILGRSITFRDTITTLLMTIIGGIFAVIMFLNGNKLL